MDARLPPTADAPDRGLAGWPARLAWGLFAAILAYSVLSFQLSSGDAGTIAVSAAPLLIAFLVALFPPRGLLRCCSRLASFLSLRTILLVAIALRVSWVVGTLHLGLRQISDFACYDSLARQILKGAFILHTTKPTGASLFIAGHYYLFGSHQIFPLLSIVAFSVLQVALTWKLALNVTRRKDLALMAALLVAIYPEHIIYCNLLGSDVLFGTYVLAVCWLLSSSKAGAWRYALAGLLLAVAHWTRPLAPIYLIATGVFALAGRDPARQKALRTAALVAAFLVGIAPIMLLNHRSIGVASPMPAQMGGWSLLVGSNIEKGGHWNPEDHQFLSEELASRKPRPGEHMAVFQDRVARELALERLRARPGEQVLLVFRSKISDLWAAPAFVCYSVAGLPRESQLDSGLAWLAGGFHWVMLLLASCAILVRRVRRWPLHNALSIYLLAALVTTLVHSVMEVQGRYHHMFLPFLAILAAARLVDGQPTTAPIPPPDELASGPDTGGS